MILGNTELNKADFCRGRRRKDQENKNAAPANVYRCLPGARRAATYVPSLVSVSVHSKPTSYSNIPKTISVQIGQIPT